jgi:hypothetical protein
VPGAERAKAFTAAGSAGGVDGRRATGNRLPDSRSRPTGAAGLLFQDAQQRPAGLLMPLFSGGLTGGEPLNHPGLEAFALLDLEPCGLDLAQRAAQHVLSLQRHGGQFEDALQAADRTGGCGDVIGQQQQPCRR